MDAVADGATENKPGLRFISTVPTDVLETLSIKGLDSLNTLAVPLF